ncbi:hypothetical protein M422DRAFT_777026 [Sphaerobolus stellatus SS14]|nr:hypothetical protein M422DRAFT_777026 [Sphaerobolus stellatus SS14]
MENSFASSSFPTEYEADWRAINLGRILRATLDESHFSVSQGFSDLKGYIGAHSAVASQSVPSTALLSHESQTIEAVLPQASSSVVVLQLQSPGRSPPVVDAQRCYAILPLTPLDNQSIQQHINKFLRKEGLILKCHMRGCHSPAFHDELEAQEHVQDHFANKRFRCLW